MQVVALDRCLKCHLHWLNEDGAPHCPRCKAHSNMTRQPVIVAGVQVQVKAIVLHGAEVGLLDYRVRRGLDKLVLGERCEHGFITYRICPQCYHRKILDTYA